MFICFSVGVGLLYFLSSLQALRGQAPECFGNPPDECLDCAFDSYKSKLGIENYFSYKNCSQKENTVNNKEIYISNKKCLAGTPCNGTLNYPYDNIVAAFYKEGNTANSKVSATLVFKILGSPHFILKSHLPNGREQLFRRLNATITVKPHYCEDYFTEGCFAFQERPIIYIKVDLFYLYVSYIFKVQNLTFDGSDLHLHISSSLNSSTADYNKESNICTFKLINASYTSSTKTPCALLSRVIKLGEPKDLTSYVGLFVLEGILDSPSLQIPELVIENCEFNLLYGVKLLDGWVALIVINDNFPSNVKIINCVFSSFRFMMGLLYVHTREDFQSRNENYSTIYRVYPRSFEFNNVFIQSYNEFHIQGNGFLYDNKREYDVYGIINIAEFKGNINISKSVFLNIPHKVRRHSFFLISKINLIRLTDVVFKNISLLSHIFYIKYTNVEIDGAIFEYITLYTYLMRCYFSNVSIVNTAFKDFSILGQSELFFETVYQYSGMLFLRNVTFQRMTNLTFYFKMLTLNIIETILYDFETFYEHLFTFIDSDIMIKILSLRNVLSICQNIFSMKTYVIRGKLKSFFSEITLSNVTKKVSVFQLNETYGYDLIPQNVTKRTVFPLEAIFRISDVGAEDVFHFENGTILDLETNNFFDFGNLGLIFISIIEWKNAGSSNYKANFIKASIFKVLVFDSVYLKSIQLKDGLFRLLSYGSYSQFNNIILDSLTTNGVNELFSFKGGTVSFRNLIISRLIYNNFSSKPASLILAQEGNLFDISNTTVIFKGNATAMSILYIFDYKSFVSKDVCGNFDYRTTESDQAIVRSALFLLNFVYSVFIDNVLLKNFREFKNDSIITQNGFLNIMGSQQNLVIFEKNNFSVYISNVIFINCSEGIVGIFNYNRAYLRAFYFLNCKSIYGGAIFKNYIGYSEISGVYMENVSALKGGGFYLVNTEIAYIKALVCVNCSSFNSGGAIHLSFVEEILVDSVIFILASSQFGGIFYMEGTNSTVKNLVAINVLTSADGGLIYFLKECIFLQNISTSNIISASGGLLFLQESVNVTINEMKADHITIDSKGAALFVYRVKGLKLSNITISSVYAKTAQGNIYIENQESGHYYFNNIKINEINLNNGILLILFSNCHVTMVNTTVGNCYGNILLLKSYVLSVVEISNTSFFRNFGSYNLVDANGVILTFLGENNYFLENSVAESLFAIENGQFSIQNAVFSNITCKYLFLIFQSITSFLNISQTEGQVQNFINHKLGYSFIKNLIISSCAGVGMPCFKYSELSSIICEKLIFQAHLDNDAEIFRIESSQFYLLDSIINRTQSKGSGKIISDIKFVDSFSHFIIKNSRIINRGFVISVNLLDANAAELINVEFEYSINSNNGIIEEPRRATVVSHSSALFINCTFKNFLFTSGPSISVVSLDEQYFSILNISLSIFENNKAEYGGALFVKGFAKVCLDGNIFRSNKAFNKSGTLKSGIAGAIYFVADEINEMEFKLFNNIFIGNVAENFAPTVWSFINMTLDDASPNIFENNTDFTNFTNKFAGFPLSLDHTSFIINSDPLTIFSTELNPFIISGVSFTFNATIRDAWGQILIFDKVSIAKLILDGPVMHGGVSQSNMGNIFYENVVILCKPETTFQLNLTYAFNRELLFPENELFSPEKELLQKLEIFSRPCVIGELFNSDEPSCRLCPDGKYSFVDPMKNFSFIKCLPCPKNAICYSGSYITPVSGYWRANNRSTLILECMNKGACLGHQENLSLAERVHGRCAIHHSGPICSICDIDYARTSNKGLCQPCKDNVYLYLKLVLGIACIILFIGLQVNYTFKSKASSYSGIFLKLLVNHFQQISLISLVDFDWTPDIKLYFSLQDYISFLTDEFITVDCLLQKYEFSLLAQRVILSNVLPIIMSLMALLIWTISFTAQSSKRRQENENYLLSRIRVSTLVIIYILHLDILRKCFSIFNCMKIEDVNDSRVLTLSPDIQCWGLEHKYYIYVSALPGLVFWGLFVPLFNWKLFRDYKVPIINLIKSSRRSEISTNLIAKRTNSSAGSESWTTKKLQPIRVYPEGKLLSFEERQNYRSESKMKVSFKRRENVFEMIEGATKMSYDKQSTGRSLIIKDNNIKMCRLKSTEAFESKEEQMASILKFLYKGYKAKYYFWELIMFLKKLLLISIGSLSELFPNIIKPTLLLIILSINIYLQTEYRPFEKDFLNRIEIISLTTTFLTSNVGILLLTDEMKQLSNFFLVAVILINFLFLLVWFWYFFKEVVGKFTLYTRLKAALNLRPGAQKRRPPLKMNFFE